MRVLFASFTATLGGAERVLLEHALRLRDDDVVVACPPGPLAGAARAAGLAVTTLHARSLHARGRAAPRALADLAGHALELRRAAIASAPNVVVLSGMRPALAGAVALRGHVLVFLHQDLAPGRALGRALRAAAARCDAVVALSRTIADDLGQSERTAILRPGVDLRRFAPAPPPAGSRVLVLGALTAWKRTDLALNAVASVPDAQVTLAGAPVPDDPDAAAFEARLRARATLNDLAGRVTFAGPVDAAAALREHAVLLHAADREPYGMALVEALGVGRPVVAPGSAGAAEIVDASCGRLYPPGDAGGAAAALRQALDDAPRLGAAARARAVERFDVEHSAARLRAVLARVVAARG